MIMALIKAILLDDNQERRITEAKEAFLQKFNSIVEDLEAL